MSATKGNLITRLPEAIIIAALAATVGYLIHEAGLEKETTMRIDDHESRIEALEEFHPRQK